MAMDPWELCRRPPVVIPADEADGIERQWAALAAMPMEQRIAQGLRLSALALAARRQRLARRFPEADESGLRWAVVREVLGLPPGTAPVPRS
jgi:hypothetical protein